MIKTLEINKKSYERLRQYFRDNEWDMYGQAHGLSIIPAASKGKDNRIWFNYPEIKFDAVNGDSISESGSIEFNVSKEIESDIEKIVKENQENGEKINS